MIIQSALEVLLLFLAFQSLFKARDIHRAEVAAAQKKLLSQELILNATADRIQTVETVGSEDSDFGLTTEITINDKKFALGVSD